jgi:hypothetical protein
MSPLQKFIAIMFFYMILSYIIFPVIFYYLMGRTLASAGNGATVGSLVSIALWYFYGSKMI